MMKCVQLFTKTVGKITISAQKPTIFWAALMVFGQNFYKSSQKMMILGWTFSEVSPSFSGLLVKDGDF
jgi:hypothetical protein